MRKPTKKDKQFYCDCYKYCKLIKPVSRRTYFSHRQYREGLSPIPIASSSRWRGVVFESAQEAPNGSTSIGDVEYDIPEEDGGYAMGTYASRSKIQIGEVSALSQLQHPF